MRRELFPKGLEIATVAMDSAGWDAAGPWVDRAAPEHPSLIDPEHLLGERFGVVNVPSGIWIDEEGRIVRPPETAYPRRPAFLDRKIPAEASAREREGIEAVRRLRIDADSYVAALWDWATRGSESRYALAPDEVVRRRRPRSTTESAAAAHFAMGLHLHSAGRDELSIEHFRAALRLQPENWTYKRQAWKLLPEGRSSMEVYGTDWLSEVHRIGPENYYPRLEL